MELKRVVATMLATVALLGGLAQAAPTYSVTALSPSGRNTSSFAYGINNSGQVVGYTTDLTALRPRHAFLYSNGIMLDLDQGALGGTFSMALGINDSGQVVGAITNADYINPATSKAFLYSGGSMTILSPLGNGYEGRNLDYASAINASGQIVVNAFPHSFVKSGGSVSNLGWSTAYGINDSGQVVGSVNANGTSVPALLYENGSFGTLSGTTGFAYDINNTGQIVGETRFLPNYQHAFLYSAGNLLDLGTLGGSLSAAYSINASGQIVGESRFSPDNFGEHGFLYSEGSMIDLSTLTDGWTIISARGINDSGQIAATGYKNGTNIAGVALLLTPVPEPEAYPMMLAGLALLGIMVRRRNRTQQ